MKSIKRAAALAMSVILAAELSSCGSKATGAAPELIDDIIEETVSEPIAETSELSETVTEAETEIGSETETEAETVSETKTETESETETETETETEVSVDEQEETYDDLIKYLPEDELRNKTVKWLAYFDPWETDPTPYHESAAKLFEEKYGGELDIRYTTWKYRFSDLAVMIIGGEGVDLYPGMEPISKYTGDPMFVSYDDYVDWKSPIWSSVKDLNDPYMIDGMHHLMVCRPWDGYFNGAGAVPFPDDDNIDEYSKNAKLECYNLCRRAENPEGAVRLIECLIASYNDESISTESDN